MCIRDRDGTAVYVGASVIFVANVAGVDLTLTELISVALVGVLASVGTAGVPGAGLIMLSLAITQAGLPFGPVALVAGIDAFLDMIRSLCNVTGDLAGARIVDGGDRKKRRARKAVGTSRGATAAEPAQERRPTARWCGLLHLAREHPPDADQQGQTDPQPVSYTHLDVDKRQVPPPERAGQRGVRAPGARGREGGRAASCPGMAAGGGRGGVRAAAPG